MWLLYLLAKENGYSFVIVSEIIVRIKPVNVMFNLTTVINDTLHVHVQALFSLFSLCSLGHLDQD